MRTVITPLRTCNRRGPTDCRNSLFLVKDIKLIEGVQRRATKLVCDVAHLSYDDRLKHLGLTRLDRRRFRNDLIETYKIVSGVYNVERERFSEFDKSARRGHSIKLFKKRARLDVRKFVFSNRVVNSWNSLSENSVACISVNSFKKQLSFELELETTNVYV